MVLPEPAKYENVAHDESHATTKQPLTTGPASHEHQGGESRILASSMSATLGSDDAESPQRSTVTPAKCARISFLEPHGQDGASLSTQQLTQTTPRKRCPKPQLGSPSGLGDLDRLKSPTPLHRRLLYDTWLPEVLALATSISCLTSLAVILMCFNDRPLYDFYSPLSLNAIVAILSAAIRIPLAFVMTSALGQTKWCRISRRPTPVVVLQDIDLASRGPLVSLLHLCSSLALSLGSIGAIVLVFALAVDVVLQQSIDLPIKLRATETDQATIKTIGSYRKAGSPDPKLRGLLDSSIWNGAFQLNPSCPTADCSWGSYEYTGWCSDCESNKHISSWNGCQISLINENITDLASNEFNTASTFSCNITRTSTIGNLTWQNYVQLDPYFLPKSPAEPDLRSRAALLIVVPRKIVLQHLYDLDSEGEQPLFVIPVEDGHFWSAYEDGVIAGVQNPLFGKTALSLKWTYDNTTRTIQSSVVETQDCGIARCRKDFEVSVSNNTVQERLKTKTYLTKYRPSFPDYVDESTVDCYRDLTAPPPVWPTNMSNILRDSPELYYYDPTTNIICNFDYQEGLGDESDHISELFLGNTTIVATILYTNGSGAPTDDWGNRDFPRPDPIFSHIQYGDQLSEAMHNLTTALDTFALRGSNETVVGVAYVNAPTIVVRWQWFIFPLVLELLGTTFFVLVVIRTRRQGLRIWKTSILPFIYHGIPRQDLSLGDSDRASDMLRDAQKVKVALLPYEKIGDESKVQVVSGKVQSDGCHPTYE